MRIRGQTEPALLAIVLSIAVLAPVAAADRGAPVVTRDKVEIWAPHEAAAPFTSRGNRPDESFAIRGNGTGTCCGGWQFVYSGIRGGEAYRFRAQVRYDQLDFPRDCLVAVVLWDAWDPARNATGNTPWNYLLPNDRGEGVLDLEATLQAPDDATSLTIRYIFRWSKDGGSDWTAPEIEPAVLPDRQPVKIGVVNATKKTRDRIPIHALAAGSGLPDEVAESVDLWGSLLLAACKESPDLLVIPEVVLGGKEFLSGAIEVPGPATAPFQKIARDHSVHLVLGVRERDGDTVYNSAVLVSPTGEISGVYRKVHLAVGEAFSGTTPGDRFPVFDTGVGRLGCLICMDTTVSESMRMLALGGAEIVCFPIMGDLRASRWSPGPPSFDEDRWKAIMRTRAIDNQVAMAVARNNVLGSCIIDRSGEILAWNEGDREMIFATLPADDGYRLWNGGDFREVTFLLRRPHLYAPYSDTRNLGPLGGKR